MNKQDLLHSIRQAAEEKVVTLSEIEDAYQSGAKYQIDKSSSKKINISDALYLIGGIIVISGIAVLIGQHWNELNPIVRILSTLGSALVAFFVGLSISKKTELHVWSTAFYLVASVILPLGVYVLFDQLGLNSGGLGVEVIIALVVFLLHISAFSGLRKGIHLIFSVIYGVWLYYVSSYYFLGYGFVSSSDQFSYVTLVLGATLGLLGYGLTKTQFFKLSEVHYGFATIAILTAAMMLQGFKPDASLLWEALFPVIAFGLVFLSSELKSRSMLVLSALYLMVYIGKLTGEYFADNLGWPLALVLCGLLLMGIGYLAFSVNKRYLRRKRVVV